MKYVSLYLDISREPSNLFSALHKYISNSSSMNTTDVFCDQKWKY